MAEVLESYNFNRTHGGRKPLFQPWLDGRIYRLTQGVDFHCNTVSFKTGLSRAARLCGRRTVIHVESTSPLVIVVKVVPRAEAHA